MGSDDDKDKGGSARNDFEFGLCSCFSDCEICLCAWCCPCIQFGRNFEKLNPHNDPAPGNLCLIWCCAYFLVEAILDTSFFFLCSTLLRCWARMEFRKAMHYRERPIYDLLSAFCCSCCMLAQDGNEIKLFKSGRDGFPKGAILLRLASPLLLTPSRPLAGDRAAGLVIVLRRRSWVDEGPVVMDKTSAKDSPPCLPPPSSGRAWLHDQWPC